MARIWYSVHGEGAGHAVRSDSILERLTKEHDVLITAAEKAYKILSQKYENVKYIKGNTIVYKNNRVKFTRTTIRFFREIPFKITRNIAKIIPAVLKFKPDIIISDFETAAHYYSYILKKPCISLDNIHFSTECTFDCPVKMPKYFKPFVKVLHPKSKYYIIPSFADIKPKSPKTTKIVSPIIREAVKKLKPVNEDFVLVYQTSPSNKAMITKLLKSNNKYIIYGMNEKSRKNLIFKGFSSDGFLDDLRRCKYVIINGGFTVLSEALYLKKPILAVPIGKQYEQIYNANSIHTMKYGTFTYKLNIDDIMNFEKNIDIYRDNINKMKWDDEKTFEYLEKFIKIEMSKKDKKRKKKENRKKKFKKLIGK